MDLDTVTELLPVRDRSAQAAWRPGDAWLAGGTWLFSEPQHDLARLFDLTALGWDPLVTTPDGLEVAATCTVAELAAWNAPERWPAASVIPLCCSSFVASFKVRGIATVGGNIVTGLPAGPMISLAAALAATATVWTVDGGERRVAGADLVTGPSRTSLGPGEVLRAVHLPAASLAGRVAFRRASLTELGRTAALVVGLVPAGSGDLRLTVTGSTVRPVVVAVPASTPASELAGLLDEVLPESLWHSDLHGSVRWRKAQTYRLAEEIRAELLDGPR